MVPGRSLILIPLQRLFEPAEADPAPWGDGFRPDFEGEL